MVPNSLKLHQRRNMSDVELAVLLHWWWRDPVGRISCWGRACPRSYGSWWWLWDSGSLNIVMTSNSCNLSMIQRVSVWESVIEREDFASWWLAYILPDLRYIQRFSEVMTSCPHVYTYPPSYSSIECYECYGRYVWCGILLHHPGRWDF